MDRSHGHRLRLGRHSLENQAYLLTTVTERRRPVFSDLGNARVLVREIRRLDEAQEVESLAFVVMPDHLHWLITLPAGRNLGRVMQLLKGRSARAIRLQEDGGALWQAGYHDHALRREEDLRAVARYLVHNPLRAGLATRVGDYPHWDAVWLQDSEATDLRGSGFSRELDTT